MFAGAGVAALAAGIVLSYQVALARVPQHRAALERLVQAHTGLEVRFNALTLQWGWYGPEVVFRRVELGEPGESSALLRAPQLAVGFDVWRTLQTGQLRAGRITLVSPDIDFARERETREAAGPAKPAGASGFVRVLQRWAGGRIELQGGTLRIPDPAGSRDAMSLQLRHAALRRADQSWNGVVDVFLPERLGRDARIALRMSGDRPAIEALSGTLEFQGRRLVLAHWRELLRSRWPPAARLPQSGSGDVSFVVQLDRGALRGGKGKAALTGVTVAPMRPQGAGDSPAAGHAAPLALGDLRGEWTLRRRPAGWNLQVDELAFGPHGRDGLPASLALDLARERAHVRGRLDRARLASLAAIARWLAPDAPLGGLRIDGAARDIGFDWDVARPEGRRLQAALRISDGSIADDSKDPAGSSEAASDEVPFALEGIDAALSIGETELVAEIDSSSARLATRGADDELLTGLRIESSLRFARGDAGWELTLDRSIVRHGDTRLVLSGRLRPRADAAIDGRLEHADVALLKQVLGRDAALFGDAALRLASGRIENAEFHATRAAPSPAGSAPVAWTHSGALALRDAATVRDADFPAVESIDARIEWRGPEVRAAFDRARGGPVRLSSAQAEWRADEQRLVRLDGRASARFEDALAWLAEYPAIRRHLPQAADGIVVRGDARFNLQVSRDAGPRRGRAQAIAPASVRLTADIDRGEIVAAPGMPAIESVRGTLAFENGRMRRSALTGSWLGGPAALQLAARGTAFVLQAQGTLDGATLAELCGLDGGAISGRTAWQGEMVYDPAAGARTARWHAAATTALSGIASRLPAPLAKAAQTSVPMQVVVDGAPDAASLRVSLEGRAQALFALERALESGPGSGGWRIERGAVHAGPGIAALPARRVVAIDGHLGRADAALYAAAWRESALERDLPPIDADLTVDRLLVAGRAFPEVSIAARQENAEFEAQLDSPALEGRMVWSAAGGQDRVDVRLARLDVPAPDSAVPGESGGAADSAREPGELARTVRALGRDFRVSIEDFGWGGRALGRLTATLRARAEGFTLEDLRLKGAAFEGRAAADCEGRADACTLGFELESGEPAAALLAFGLRDDLAAQSASLDGALEWRRRDGETWLGSVQGKIALEIERGHLRAASESSSPPFALLTLPALLGTAAGEPGSALPFARLEGEFEIRDGSAFSSNLHFDGETEILVRGRTGLTARDYDYTAWVLRGEERMPAALRRFGATPGIAAAWMSLRDLFAGSGTDRSRAVLRLSGPWAAPVVTSIAQNKTAEDKKAR